MLPCFFDNKTLYISQNLGMNLAPWNYFERKVVIKDTKIFITARNDSDEELYNLIFVHFSGYDYSKLKDGIVIQRDPVIKQYGDLDYLIDIYKNEITTNWTNFIKYKDLPYTYNSFDNGISISLFHRRLYNGLLEDGNKYVNPFDTTNNDSFYSLLKKKKLLSSSLNTTSYFKIDKEVYNSKIKLANKFLYYVYKVIGYNKFLLMIDFFKKYSKYEIYTFLLNKKF